MDRQFFIASAQAMERSMYCIARSYLRCEADCEDALQNALLRAWEKRNTLRGAVFPHLAYAHIDQQLQGNAAPSKARSAHGRFSRGRSAAGIRPRIVGSAARAG